MRKMMMMKSNVIIMVILHINVYNSDDNYADNDNYGHKNDHDKDYYYNNDSEEKHRRDDT